MRFTTVLAAGVAYAGMVSAAAVADFSEATLIKRALSRRDEGLTPENAETVEDFQDLAIQAYHDIEEE